MTCSAERCIDTDCRGLLTDVLRFSLHDGPGIRTTVFFKGCPLRCPWCHNPETQSSEIELEFRSENCVRCGACVRACGQQDEGQGFSREKCVDVAAAAAACVHNALRLAGRYWTTGEVITEVLKDVPYYTATNGGVTLSGGEPLLQSDFAVALLSRAKEYSVHTCVETSGHVAEDRFTGILPLTDLLLFDWKATSAETHRELMGVSNDLIRRNLIAASNSVPVVLRCPLIPDVNDSDDHLDGVVKIAQACAVREIQVLPFHDLGSAKYIRYGRTTPLRQIAVDRDRKGHWLRVLKGAHCPVSIAGI